jgi:radical SAM superfamily enzyme YgiQ (UPF0313 family)
MDVLVVCTNRNQLPMPVLPLGACLVAEAAERAGHRVRLLDLMFEKDPAGALRRALAERPPEVVGLSVRNIDNNDLRSPVFFLAGLPPLVDAIRAGTDAPIVLGGAACGVMPEALMRLTGAAWCVLGDGETVFPALLGRLGRGESPADLPGVASLAGGVFAANPGPRAGGTWRCGSPDFRRWLPTRRYLAQLATVPLQTKVGCHFRCVYCTYRGLEGSDYRLGDPRETAEAVARLAAGGMRDVEFVDNVFNSPHGHALAVCEELARRPHGASLQSLELNPLFVDDALLAAMQRAGFAGIGVTFESAADPVLAGLGKGFTTADVHRAADAVARHRLPCAWVFMLGGPGETEATVRETLGFARARIRPGDVAYFGVGIRVYPGTQLEQIARDQGVLDLPADRMLEPVFYCSPQIAPARIREMLAVETRRTMNFMSPESLSFPYLPAMHRAAHALGMRPPLWPRTAAIRRTLRLLGMDV